MCGYYFGITDLPAWFEAAGTLLLFGITLEQLRRERGARRADQTRDFEAKRQEQAELVDAWIQHIERTPYDQSLLDLMALDQSGQLDTDGQQTLQRLLRNHPYRFTIAMSNASSRAVRAVHVGVNRIAPETERGWATLGIHIESTLSPNSGRPEIRRLDLQVGDVDIDLTRLEWAILGDFALDLSFIDAGGNRWNRSVEGPLDFIASPEDWKATAEGGRLS
ncbi:MAG: hypothetical protein ACLP1E_14380 [Acidimicrobiales bacterium]